MKGRPVFNRVEADAPHYVYRYFDADDRLIYVGCTANPPQRIAHHSATAWWWPQVDRIRNIVFPDRPTALRKESRAIYGEKPRWNINGRWYRGDRRTDWTAQEYLDLRVAILRSKSALGVNMTRLLDDLETELATRFNITALPERRAAA